MAWKQKWPQNHKTSKFRISSLESSALKLCWLGCTRYQVDTVRLNHWRKPVLMSLTVTHIFIAYSTNSKKLSTLPLSLPKYCGANLGSCHPPKCVFFSTMEQKAPSGFASSGLGLAKMEVWMIFLFKGVIFKGSHVTFQGSTPNWRCNTLLHHTFIHKTTKFGLIWGSYFKELIIIPLVV